MTIAKRLIVAITGASGSLYALALLKILEKAGVESHGIISAAGRQVLKLELERDPEDLPGVARWHDINDLAAPMASGSALVVQNGALNLGGTVAGMLTVAGGTATFSSGAQGDCVLHHHTGDLCTPDSYEPHTTPLPARIYANEGIAQVLFFEADEPCEISYADKKGKYQSQQSIVLPKIL